MKYQRPKSKVQLDSSHKQSMLKQYFAHYQDIAKRDPEALNIKMPRDIFNPLLDQIGVLLLLLQELPWKTYVLSPRFMASQSHELKAAYDQHGRKIGRTHLCCPDAADPDLLPRLVLKNLIAFICRKRSHQQL